MSMVSKKNKIPIFLLKLYNLLNNDIYNNSIQWGYIRGAFIIKDFETFCYHIMPKIFGYSLFSSFHRRLNCYGFIKINENEFYNKYFIKDNKNSLLKIKRKTNLKKKLKKLSSELLLCNKKSDQAEEKLNLLIEKHKQLINENIIIKKKLIEQQNKQKDLSYIFFYMVEFLYPKFALIRNHLFFFNSNDKGYENIFDFINEYGKKYINNVSLLKNSNNENKNVTTTETNQSNNSEEINNLNKDNNYDFFMDVD